MITITNESNNEKSQSIVKISFDLRHSLYKCQSLMIPTILAKVSVIRDPATALNSLKRRNNDESLNRRASLVI